MRYPIIAALFFSILSLTGCISSSKVNESSFRGFCYQSGGKNMSCDNIAICDQYLSVFENPQTSEDTCLQACEDIGKNFSKQHPVDECEIVSKDGLSWCQRYCRQTHGN
jgi:hypothetical protein